MKKKIGTGRISIFLETIFVIMLFCLVLPQSVMADSIKQISMGATHSAALTTNGDLWMWGENKDGQLGNGDPYGSKIPVKIMAGVKQVCLGFEHSAAIKNDGSLWMWGDNKCGQLGNGNTEDVFFPVKIMDNVKEVSLGMEHSAAIKNDGSLWIWGWNAQWQLGNKDETYNSVPKKIMTDVKQVSLGSFHSAAIKTDGSLWMWGDNQVYELGNDDAPFSEPTQVMSGVKEVSLGHLHTAILKTDGTLWLCGGNSHGEVGMGENTHRSTLVEIMSDVKQISLGDIHSAALKNDGSLWLWGDNSFGQVGNGTTQNISKPIKILTDVKQVDLGQFDSAAVKNDGSFWTWGSNMNGVLGNNSYSDSSIPIEIILPDLSTTKINMSKCEIILSQKSYAYTGNSITPLPTVKYNGKTLNGKTDYVISYRNNKNPGTAKIIVTGKGSYIGQKEITFTIGAQQLATPKAPTVSNVINGINVKWTKVSGATKYRVFYKVGSGNWNKLVDTTKTAVTWTGAKSGTTYAFCVQCTSADGKSYTSPTGVTSKKLKYITAPTNIKAVKSGANNIKISWLKSAGATKYRVFYKTGSGKWKKLTDTTQTSFIWKKGKKGTTYTFTVRCVTSNGKSYTSAYDTTGFMFKL